MCRPSGTAALPGGGSVAIVPGAVGAASSIKMIRSVMVKGLEALTAECFLAADAAGVTEAVRASLDASWPGTDWGAKADYNLERMMAHGIRRAAEMEEVAKTLDAEPNAATMVLVHHNPRNSKEKDWQCLWDTEELLAILRPRKQVKALMFGHSHRWELGRDGDLHFVNLPAVGYPFDAKQPLGWCRFEPRRDGATLALHRVDEPGAVLEPIDLKWRAS